MICFFGRGILQHQHLLLGLDNRMVVVFWKGNFTTSASTKEWHHHSHNKGEGVSCIQEGDFSLEFEQQGRSRYVGHLL